MIETIPHDLRRVLVIGTSCSGKTTLARRLAERLQCPTVELDALHWAPDWVEVAAGEFRARAETAAAQERWVIDGNYSVVRDILWPRATAVVWLDYSFPRVFARALARTIRRCATGETLFSGNRERFVDAFFRRESILLWVITTWKRNRTRYHRLREERNFPQLEWIRLRRPAEAEELLRRAG
jgi:adenylate kinase family enzyme